MILKTAKEIREWMSTQTPPVTELHAYTPRELHAMDFSKPSRKVPDDGQYYGVVHILHTADGCPLITLRRVYIAKNADEALRWYLFGPSRHPSGRGEECVDVTLWKNFRREPQRIDVFPLTEGTDHFY